VTVTAGPRASPYALFWPSLRLALQELEAVDRKGDVDRYEVDAKVLAGDLREAWERAVEELLFRGVVMRFQRDVSARKFLGRLESFCVALKAKPEAAMKAVAEAPESAA
jgi:hypothetical protein